MLNKLKTLSFERVLLYRNTRLDKAHSEYDTYSGDIFQSCYPDKAISIASDDTVNNKPISAKRLYTVSP